MRFRSVFLALPLFLASLVPGAGQERASFLQASDPSGESLRVSLLTMGPGDAVWEKFSHNAILVQDLAAGWARAYNWGIFDFGQVDFIPRLIRGTMLYKMAPMDAERSLEEYRRTNRSVWLQELALTPRQRLDLLAFVEWNARPENRDYRYDYYRDNCSTRVRDVLDQTLGGALRLATGADTTNHTYRWHTRRLLQTVPAAYVGIQFVLGGSADRPLTAWEEMFLPIRLMEELREIQIPDGAGGSVPLVTRETRILESSRPPIPQTPPFALPGFLLVGVLWGGGIFLLSRRGWMARLGGSREGVGWRVALTTLAGGWALVASLSGSLLLGAWLFTDHVFWYRNLNLLQVNPLFLALLPAFGAYLFTGTLPRWGRDLSAAFGVVALVGMVMSAVPGVGQQNGEILALTIPVNLGLALASLLLAADPQAGHAGAPSSEDREPPEGHGDAAPG